MIELTVKTLDSQNHAFTVDENLTVAQFKEKIAEAVNIPANTQRIIYCGRLLQDESKLCDHDLNAKVVHLVQKPPPVPNDRANERPESPPPVQPHIRRLRGLEYLGSMRFPSGGLEPDTWPSLPTHSLAASRLNVARRMLRRAEALLSALENPTARPSDQQTQEEPQEEMTPIFEARVIVPSEAVVLSSNVLNENNSISSNTDRPVLVSVGAVPTESGESQPAESEPVSQMAEAVTESDDFISDPPEALAPLIIPSENVDEPGNETAVREETTAGAETRGVSTSEPTTSNNGNNGSENGPTDRISRTTEFADLLSTLSSFQTRFAPFLDQYLNFMRDDPPISDEALRSTQALINRVSEILHFLGHAYHSLSDIIVRARTPPPRPLLCRPILVQHSAILQAGIPIQVEAQINFSSDRNANNSTSNTSATSSSSSTVTSAETTTTTTTAASENADSSRPAQSQPAIVGVPLMSRPNVRVETFQLPVGASFNRGNSNSFLRTSVANLFAQTAAMANSNTSEASSGNNTSNQPNDEHTRSTGQPRLDPAMLANAIASRVVEGLNSTTSVEAGTTFTSTNTMSGNTQGTPNNPNVEFFMEVTPESITIDSVETAFVAQGSDFMHGSLNPAPPELIHSLMQMAGQFIARGAQVTTSTATSTTATPLATPANSTQTSSTTSTTAGAARTTPFQNSQARGNTQTQPTTATHTRSTARPHVHLSQHAMQGFDPFLPCNSHHVTSRRRFHPPLNGQNQNQNGSANTNSSSTPLERSRVTYDPTNPLHFLVRHIVNSARPSTTTTTTAETSNTSNAGNVTTTSTASNGDGRGATSSNVSSSLLGNLQTLEFVHNGSLPPQTIAQLLFPSQHSSIIEGESICTDLVLMLCRNFTISDIVSLGEGHLDSLTRIRTELRNFFSYRILDGTNTSASVERGVEKILSEMQLFLNQMVILNTRDDIDIVKSIQTLLRSRLPNLIRLAISNHESALKMLMEQLRTTARYMCALIVRASANGTRGVEELFDSLMRRYLASVPPELRSFATLASTATFASTENFAMFISNLDVSESILQPFIVRKIEAITTCLAPNTSMIGEGDENMEVEEEIIVTNNLANNSEERVNLSEDSEPLPAVVLGSEPWHNQVPADWVPIITRDSQRQRKQTSQPPFSDAYLSGMPSKRRKIVASSKPLGNFSQVINESVRHAVSATGLTNVAPLDAVAQAAGTNLEIQSAYRDMLRTTVQSELGRNEDFTPERFPNASDYFKDHNRHLQ